ncbi:uncharacterized protein LOC132349914 [Balaenoptera ricei]|uniref:uncharacterized protein LOC132349914 n=1 Tax=Balaenoptera ricei TaxID=2746895 RepID=UPI0028BD35E0|nr:uncharacterized protein LOC132349914 [Balaenoptera ricei]
MSQMVQKPQITNKHMQPAASYEQEEGQGTQQSAPSDHDTCRQKPYWEQVRVRFALTLKTPAAAEEADGGRVGAAGADASGRRPGPRMLSEKRQVVRGAEPWGTGRTHLGRAPTAAAPRADEGGCFQRWGQVGLSSPHSWRWPTDVENDSPLVLHFPRLQNGDNHSADLKERPGNGVSFPAECSEGPQHPLPPARSGARRSPPFPGAPALPCGDSALPKAQCLGHTFRPLVPPRDPFPRKGCICSCLARTLSSPESLFLSKRRTPAQSPRRRTRPNLPKTPSREVPAPAATVTPTRPCAPSAAGAGGASHQGEATATRWTPAGPQTESLGPASLVLGPSRGFSDQRGHQEGCESGEGSLDTHSGSRLSLYNLLGGSRPLLWDRAEHGITEGAAPSDGGRLWPFPSAAGGCPRLPRCSLFAGRVEGRRGASQSHPGTPARPVSPPGSPALSGRELFLGGHRPTSSIPSRGPARCPPRLHAPPPSTIRKIVY